MTPNKVTSAGPNAHSDEEQCPTCCGLGHRLAVVLDDAVEGAVQDWQYTDAGICETCGGSGIHRCMECGAVPANYQDPRNLHEGLCEECHDLLEEFQDRYREEEAA